ncbi:MAG TPA: VCBS repeat-containing protein [Verrucomicrobiae bacterium]
MVQLRIAALVFAMAQTVWGAVDWRVEGSARWRTLEVEVGAAGFERVMGSGVGFTNTLSEEAAAKNRTLYNGSGVAAGDFDGDGLADLVFAGVENRLDLFRNLGGWKFANVTARSGVRTTNAVLRGVVLADVDGDGALDLLATANGRGVLAWRNDGKGNFTDVTREWGTASGFGSMTLALADVDGNGTLDLYVANNRSDDIRDRGEVQLSMVGGKPSVPPALRNRLVLFGGQILEYGEPDVLLLNDGKGKFSAATWNRFIGENGQALPGAPLDWGLSATFRDLNGDGAPDLYVCNDFWTPDRIWLNDGRGNFRAAPPLAFRQTSGSSMGVDVADLNFDGAPDVFVLDMLSRSPAMRKRQMDAQASSPNLPGRFTDRPQILRNTMFLARGDGSYAEVANYAGVAAADWAWQPVFLDVDLDGHQDIIITAGHARDVQDRDANAVIRGRARNYSAIANVEERRKTFQADLLANMRLYPELRMPIVAFRNLGGVKFGEATSNWGTSDLGIHHGIATADFDGDGDFDFAVNNLNSAAGVYRNKGGGTRVAVRLKGKAPNTQGVGALVTLRGGAAPVQQQEVVSGGKYLSGSEAVCVFAGGTNARGMTLEVKWRNGLVTTVREVSANRLYEISEEASAEQRPKQENKQEPAWFEDVSDRIQHVHHEGWYDDFARQPLLPHRLSQLGPGVTWADLDGDRREELIVGTGAGGRLGVFRNTDGAFSPWTNAPFQQPLARDTTSLLAIPGPDEKINIFAGLASYEDGRTNTASIFRFDAGIGAGVAAWPDLPSSAGPMCAADYDADGDLDFFIGARVLPGRWPTAGKSVLLRNDAGNWVPEELGETNAVSAAMWSDLDADGWPELVVAGEFGAVRIYKNAGGKLGRRDWNVRLPGGKEVKLDEVRGWWTSVNAGDFDGDGLMDLVVGNWGENTEHHASAERPMKLVTGQFGTPHVAIMETVFDPAANGYVPSRSLDEAGQGLPFLVGRFGTHAAYSTNTVENILGERNSEAKEWVATELRTVLLLNRKSHFEMRALPMEAQLAPVFGTVVGEFDLDGNEDLFLAQNFFGNRTGVARNDAGRGLVLRGDGTGGFSAVAGQVSGIAIYGEQRGAAACDFDRDGRLDFAVAQNGAATKLYRNLAKGSGLRITMSGGVKNPNGVGCVVRLKSGGAITPAREIRAGSGYWSQDSGALVFAVPESFKAAPQLEIEVLRPGGGRRLITVSSGSREINVEL